jgi:hypothetical protein
MTITTANIDIGDLPNDGTGDPLRTAFEKINQNFAELAELIPQGPNNSFQFNAGEVFQGTANLTYDVANNVINIGGNLVPTTSVVHIGSNANRISNIWLANSGLAFGNVRLVESANTISFPLLANSSQKASLDVNNLTITGNTTIAGGIEFGNTQLNSFQVITSNNSANQVLFQVPVNEFNFGSFELMSREANSNNSQLVNITVSKNTNNLDVSYCVSGTVFSGNVVVDYNCDVGFSNVRLMVNPFPNTQITHIGTFKIYN